MDEHLEISDAAQYKALGHPLRHRLLFALGTEAATISQLAKALDQRKGNIAHHLGVLQEAGLVRIVETRQVRGGTEHYYRRSARRLSFTGPDAASQGPILMRAVADELAIAEPVGSRLRNVRLTAEQAATVAAALEKMIDDLQDAGDDAERYGLLVTVYKPR
ncbi:ArsR/SmtB family transcription factor [Cryptosporangium aurantiacum]|uniref:Helix-turn-helix domain-containing protein n=1 Tax=Cryptosporangium aurantiacum TaxID=134849 RepID=A0A1M7HIM0_9ACTN|nr:helix-turn-helix domain-containing protein [Cryptosporangium aurantiacum]SHM28304.1 Helix-turn-helix domain-containing protein [Cryptosporangium aurantiacum]